MRAAVHLCAAALALAGTSAALAEPAPAPPPWTGVYQPQGVDEIGLWGEDDESERKLAASPHIIRDEKLLAYLNRKLRERGWAGERPADPQALVQCMAAKDAYEFLGSPEGELALVQSCIYLATAPKSNAAYKAQKASFRSAKETGSLMPPQNILNAPTKLMKDIGYGSGYTYDHDADEGFSGDDYWPEEMEPQSYYQPVERGFEREVKKRLDYWDKLRRDRAQL